MIEIDELPEYISQPYTAAELYDLREILAQNDPTALRIVQRLIATIDVASREHAEVEAERTKHLGQLYDMITAQAEEGNWNCSSYATGLLNGLIIASGILSGSSPIGLKESPPVQNTSSIVTQLIAEGYTRESLPSIDIDLCAEAICDECGHKGMKCIVFRPPDSLRLVAECPGCGWNGEF